MPQIKNQDFKEWPIWKWMEWMEMNGHVEIWWHIRPLLSNFKESPEVRSWHPNVCIQALDTEILKSDSTQLPGWAAEIRKKQQKKTTYTTLEALMPSAAAQQSWRLFWEIGLSWLVWSPQLQPSTGSEFSCVFRDSCLCQRGGNRASVLSVFQKSHKRTHVALVHTHMPRHVLGWVGWGC